MGHCNTSTGLEHLRQQQRKSPPSDCLVRSLPSLFSFRRSGVAFQRRHLHKAMCQKLHINRAQWYYRVVRHLILPNWLMMAVSISKQGLASQMPSLILSVYILWIDVFAINSNDDWQDSTLPTYSRARPFFVSFRLSVSLLMTSITNDTICENL